MNVKERGHKVGYYIETPVAQAKAAWLVGNDKASPCPHPPGSISELDEDHILVCVVENGPFDAAGVCHNDRELERFNDPRDLRPKTWLVMERGVALEMAPWLEGAI